QLQYCADTAPQCFASKLPSSFSMRPSWPVRVRPKSCECDRGAVARRGSRPLLRQRRSRVDVLLEWMKNLCELHLTILCAMQTAFTRRFSMRTAKRARKKARRTGLGSTCGWSSSSPTKSPIHRCWHRCWRLRGADRTEMRRPWKAPAEVVEGIAGLADPQSRCACTAARVAACRDLAIAASDHSAALRSILRMRRMDHACYSDIRRTRALPARCWRARADGRAPGAGRIECRSRGRSRC